MIVIIPTSCILILSDQNTKEVDEVKLVQGFFNKLVSHYVIYFVVNFSFTPFANNWKLMFAMNSIAWYTSIVVSGFIEPGGAIIHVG